MSNIEEYTENKQDLRKRIIEVATHEFLHNGIKAVKMDDIAKAMTASKRTIYEMFENKEQLLLECVKAMFKKEDDHMNAFVKGGKHSVISIVIEYYRFQMQNLTGVSPLYYEDVMKYPIVMNWLNKQKANNEDNALEFFSRGVKEGYFRSNVDYRLISYICDSSMEAIIRQRLFKQYSMKQIFRDVILLYIRGLCTLKGIEKLEELI